MRRTSILEKKKDQELLLGGLFDRIKSLPSFSDKTKDAIETGGALGAGLIDNIDPQNEEGVQSTGGAVVSGALKGASALKGAGILGTAAGAIGGALFGWIGNKKRKRAARRREAKRIEGVNKDFSEKVRANRAADQYADGNPDANMYKIGGTLKGIPASKFSSSGTTIGRVRVKSEMPDISIRPAKFLKNGGSLIDKGDGRFEVEGNSHAEGGVKIPELGAELEGNETISGDFVFSDFLGFAKKHKNIIKGIENSKKDNSTLSRNTIKALERKEEMLKLTQEQLKREMGEQNEIDDTAEELKDLNKTMKFKKGGKLKSLQDGGKIFKNSNRRKVYSDAEQRVPFAYTGNDNLLYKGLKGVGSVVDRIRGGFRGKPIFEFESGTPKRNEVVATAVPTAGTTPSSSILDVSMPDRFKKSPTSQPSVRSTPSRGTSTPISASPSEEALSPVKALRSLGKLPGVTTNTGDLIGSKKGKTHKEPVVELPETSTASAKTTHSPKSRSENTRSGSNLLSTLGDATPFITNVVNSFRRLPEVPVPENTPYVNPRYVDLSASRQEVRRQIRGANRGVDQSLSSANTATAVKTGNLVQSIRAINEVNERENMANVGIANETSRINSSIAEGNANKRDFVKSQVVQRAIKQQEMRADNLADFANKIQLAKRDRAEFEREDTRILLTMATDDTGASWRAGKEILKNRLSPKVYKELEKVFEDRDKYNKEDREAALKRAEKEMESKNFIQDPIRSSKTKKKSTE